MEGDGGVRLNMGATHFPNTTCLLNVPSKNLGVNIFCHPLGALGKQSFVKILMPTYNKRWVQCVSGWEKDNVVE